MAKIFKSNLSTDAVNIPTAEQNQAEFMSMQEKSQENIDAQTADYLAQEKKKQYFDFDAATMDAGQKTIDDKFGNTGSVNQNQDMSQQPVANDLDDVHRSWASQFQESFIKGFGETVIGSTGDVINLITAPLPAFTLSEGNILGRALREYGDEMGDEHTTFLAKKLEGQELSWGSLADKDFWSTNVAEMIPMALEFMVTGFGAGSAAKKGMGLIVKGMTNQQRLARATLAVADKAKQLATGVKVAEDVLGTGKGLAKYLTRNVDGVLEMSKLSKEFSGAAGAGLANNLLAGATNAMDFHRTMKAENDTDIANGFSPRYTEDEMASVAAGSMALNLLYAPVDMLSWGISYAKGAEKIGAGMAKKIGMKAADKVAKEAAEAFTKTSFPVFKGLATTAGHAGFEGGEEILQETYEQWASQKANEMVTGVPVDNYWEFLVSKENKNTVIASFAMGGVMGGAMNLKINEAAQKGVDYTNRMETLKATIDAYDKGGHNAQTYHIRNQMVDLLYANKTEAFDGFLSDLVARGTVTGEEVEYYQQEFKDISEDFNNASSLNVAGKFALIDNTVKAKSITRFIENEHASYEEKVRVIKEQFGEEDQSLLNADETARLANLKEQEVIKPNPQVQENIRKLEQTIKDRSSSAIQKKYAKLQQDHEQQIEMLSLNLALANENRLNLISGKKADPLNLKFWTNHNGTEMAYITEEVESDGASWTNRNGKLVRDDGYEGNQAVTDYKQRGLTLSADKMTEGQAKMNIEQGGIVAGLSDAQYEKFVKMTDEQVFEAAKTNHEAMLKKLSKRGREGYEKIVNAGKEVVEKGKEFGKKMKAKLDANGEPIVDKEGNVEMEEDTETETEVTETEPTPTNPNAPPSGEENEFEKGYVSGGLETFEQWNERKKIAEEEKFRQEAEGKNDTADDTDEETETAEAPNYKVVQNKNTGKYYLVDEKGEMHPSGKSYLTTMSAKKDLGNASIVGDVASGAWSLTKGAAKLGGKAIVGGAKLGAKGFRFGKKAGQAAIKKGKETAEQLAEDFQLGLEQAAQSQANSQNKAQDALRRKIIEDAYYGAPARYNAANPHAGVSKQELDRYLDSKIAQFRWGPRAIEEQYTVNRMLKAKGIDVNVVMAQNLFSLVGIPAVGYALASTIYIDEKVWNQPAVFMHEMSHIHYRVSQNSPETKAVVAFAREDKKLVDRVERMYANKVVFYQTVTDPKGKEIEQVTTLQELTDQWLSFDEAEGETAQSAKKEFEDTVKEVGGIDNWYKEVGVRKAPDSEQAVINEELFTHILQGPMAKNFNQALEPIRERRRVTVSKGWWSWLKGRSVVFDPLAADIVEKLNDNKPVRQEELFDHVMTQFESTLTNKSKKALTAGGFAMLVDEQEAEVIADHKRITAAKIEERKTYDPVEAKAQNRMTQYEKYAKKIKAEIDLNMKDFSEIERRNALEYQLEELETSMLEEGAFDDYEMAKSVQFRGATRILNSFTKSLNYVKRKRFVSEGGVASQFNENDLIDRDALIAEFYTLAFEHKGNVNGFIRSIENSRVEEVFQFNQYMEKMHPGKKLMYLSSMAQVMGNTQTISAVKTVVNAEGKWEVVNALSETERHKVDNHMETLADHNRKSFNQGENTNDVDVQSYRYFEEAYKAIKNKTQNADSYLDILRALAPPGIKYSALVNNQTINMKGHNVNVRVLIDMMVKSGLAEKDGKIYVYGLKPFIEAIVDSNRKFTSYSVIQNAEGNMEPSKITNNHLLSEINGMNEFLVKDAKGNFPKFIDFKRRYSHLSDAANRTHENPVLRSIYDNAKNNTFRPSVVQYAGLSHLQRNANSLYKGSTDFTQTIEDFMLFANKPESATYVQTLSAMADSPRKFMMTVPRAKHKDMFNPDGTLRRAGTRMLEAAWRVYEKSNETLPPKKKAMTIQSKEDFISKFEDSVSKEIARWNENAKDLITNKTINPTYFTNGKLNTNGEAKIREFVFNQAVNGMALAEIFNPGIPFNDIVKRNKGNSSPVFTFGNKNLKMEAIPINDEGAAELGSNSGMYMTEAMAQKIIDAGLGVMDLNKGLKLLNYHVERDNPNFKGKSAYFKGYTTIISEKTLITEPGLAGIYDLLVQREEKYNQEHFKEFGEMPSLDITNGENNYINYAVPYSAIKSELFSDEQKASLSGITYEALEGTTGFDEMNQALDAIYYGPNKKGEIKFMGLSTNNFGPQQIMDKVTEEAVTPVQFMSSVIVNGMVGNNLEMGEEIQKLIRTDMKANLDSVLDELGNMEPNKYKAFILKNLDLENMDQTQRLMIEESLTNLNHPAISDFITNTLANRLKQEGNKLKTTGTIAQQKPSLHYRYRNGYTVGNRSGLAGFTNRFNADGSVGSMPNEIVLPNHMKDKVVFRQYLTIEDPQVKRIIDSRQDLHLAASKAVATGDWNDVMKEVALSIARLRHGKARTEGSYGYDVNDYIGQFEKDGQPASWFVRGETVMGTRIPSHGPASTGVFEAVDYLEGEGNQTIVSEEFSDVAGSDYDGDSLFIQRKSKGKEKATPNFNEALLKTVDLWTSPGMYAQIRAKIEFEAKVRKVTDGNTVEKAMPMSPAYHRENFNNTMISKRNIGIIFNTHRIANYLAAYNVKLNSPIFIDSKRVEEFSDAEVGQESRNNQSAMLANIILDNTKWGFADSLGLNDQTINQYSLLINMGFSLKQVNDIMNSKAVKVWNKHKSNNSNPYAVEMKNKDVKEAILKELGIRDSKVDKISISTKVLEINTPEQMRHIIHMMETLEAMNADILHVSKIMAGHKGIENNPFILEQQIKAFDEVVDSKNEKPLFTFPAAFKNNPDIKAYHDNATTILKVMQKANNIYSTSTSELIETLNGRIGYNNQMTKTQMERASDVIKKFHTSRILGLNNTTAAEKKVIKRKVFKEILAYQEALKTTPLPGNKKLTEFSRSVLFNRALNVNIFHARQQKPGVTEGAKLYDEKSYVSANPRFFNESITEEDRIAVQREYIALPQSIKDGLLTLDLMKNGLTGKLSLSAIFDEKTNFDISKHAANEAKTKNNPVDKKVMDRLENLIISNEFNVSSSIQNAQNATTPYKVGDNILTYIRTNNEPLSNALKIGNSMLLKIDGQPYTFEGLTQKEKDDVKKIGDDRLREQTKAGMLLAKIKPFAKTNGDVNLEAISIADTNGSIPTYKSRGAEKTEGAEYMDNATEKFESKLSKKKVKSDLGNASLIDYHNYTDVAPLNQREFNVVMEYDNTISDEQKELVYKAYLQDKKEANDLMSQYNQETFSKMSDSALKSAYVKFAQKDMYAYSVITTPLVMEFANRAGAEQSNDTKEFENGKDISLASSWLDGNNISSNHPVTQNLVKKIGLEYKKFIAERGKYIKKINVVTDALYQEKFGLSSNKYVRLGQRVVQSLLKNRITVYETLYGNLVDSEPVTDANGVEKKTLKFKTEETIKAMRAQGKISDAEFNFYTVFRETTAELKKFDGNDKVRKDYIPHTAMNNFEQFANRGLLGLLVNSKGLDNVVEDVKVYAEIEGKKVLMTFRDVKSHYNALAYAKKQTNRDLITYKKLEITAKKLQKTGLNEDGSRLIYSNMQNETLLGMSPLSRFSNSRSGTAEIMPSMDLNKSLVEYVHASMFTNGNGTFKGFKAMMPLIDGVMAYNDKNGYKNAYNYVKEVVKEGFIMKKEQITFGKNTDAVINGLIKSNTIYALGYKGLLVGKGVYAIGNLAIGKYMNIKREGGKAWALGEARYWGVDKGISLDLLSRRRRARNILSNIGYMEADFHDDVNIEAKSGIDGVFMDLALFPMSVTESWIQEAHLLGMLTDEEFNKFDENGNYKTGETQILPERFQILEERVKNSHGKGFSPTDQSRMHKYALGKMFMQFSRHLPTQFRERFAKEDIDMNGKKYIGSLRQVGRTAVEIWNNRMEPAKLKEYYENLEPHEKEALLSGLRGMALMTVLGMVAGNAGDASQMNSDTDASSIASGVQSDANIHFDADRLSLKAIPPAIRSTMSVMKMLTHGGQDGQQ